MVNVLTYNMSWATQINKTLGSEANFVEACQKKYTKKGGIQCNSNAIKNIGKLEPLDLLAIQEVNSNLESKIKKVQPKLSKSERGTVGLSTVATLWNPKVFGKLVAKRVVNVSKDKEDFRPALFLVLKKKVQIVIVVNVHMPWVIGEHAKKTLERVFRELKVTNNDKIIMLGDFNDSKTTIHKNKPLTLKNIKLSPKKNKAQLKKTLKSCCWHKKGHKYGYFTDTGDYILVNKNVKQVSIEIPKIFRVQGKLNRLFSDHMPVFSVLIL